MSSIEQRPILFQPILTLVVIFAHNLQKHRCRKWDVPKNIHYRVHTLALDWTLESRFYYKHAKGIENVC
ncbi:MAG: hypothetical protein FRX48_04997 [Lasallia pustulata]|uniref:Uncharacterized protein n=1 Tax=Lasallia pustulata TaxID=136370 RepID=A0A5M8PQ74_9LECA|nr:MAG: hypothetical protein FRX48_04997 [Lasallia pustulata]